MIKRLSTVLLIVMSPLLLISSAHAATANTTFEVTATINAVCNISATNMVFGVYDPLSVTSTDATSTVTLNCTPNTFYRIALNAGLHSGGSYTPRKMKLGAGPELMDYNIFTASDHANIWGNDSPGTVTVFATTPVGAPSPVNVTAFGSIPAGQTSLPTGAYADTIDATVTF